jgi:CDP-diacylglycerol--glycerol-3-phosphate 3-phosphatidyltransferase
MNSLSFFSRACPGFAVRGDSVRVINEPSEFYSELLARAAAATRRITLAALYLGTGDTERALVDAVAKRAEEKPLRVRVMLDFCRGTRADDQGQSSCSLLQKLIEGDAVLYLTHFIVLSVLLLC